jgi:CRISPR type I-E-associated protein CasA/Cse1
MLRTPEAVSDDITSGVQMLPSTTAFRLDDGPWVEVVDLSGRPRVVSLREVFAASSELRAIGGEIPTIAFAVLRLMLAVLHSAINGPADVRAWRELWREKHLPMSDINAYLDRHRDRFDLLHAVTPFYQVADLRTASGDATGLARIIADVPNGVPYLTSRLGQALTSITAAEAARWLGYTQAFDTSGIKSGATRVPNGNGPSARWSLPSAMTWRFGALGTATAYDETLFHLRSLIRPTTRQGHSTRRRPAGRRHPQPPQTRRT